MQHFCHLLSSPVSFALLSPLLPNFLQLDAYVNSSSSALLVTEAGSWSVNSAALDKTQSAKICQPFPQSCCWSESPPLAALSGLVYLFITLWPVWSFLIPYLGFPRQIPHLSASSLVSEILRGVEKHCLTEPAFHCCKSRFVQSKVGHRWMSLVTKHPQSPVFPQWAFANTYSSLCIFMPWY